MNKTYNIVELKVGDVNNCMYIVINVINNECVIIDPAWDFEKIDRYVHDLNIVPKGIMLTHSHRDHTNLADKLAVEYEIPVYMSKKEIDYYEFRCSNLCQLDDMDEIIVAKLKFKCFLTPGHTIGSMCYKIGNNIFTGDTIFTNGCGFCNCRGGSVDDMFNSVVKIKRHLTIDTNIYPGHRFKENVYEKTDYFKRNIYLNITDKSTFKKLIYINDKRNIFLKFEYK
ncbi:MULTISPECIES: MBL fold metallo-hydrolase [Peptoniphilaceae]|uniref:MBL fold metallo-hydrolase n=1 Tax=Peptoniphilaceae TaxID=1570339 RepID=UPI0002881C7D|nr:MULTISPECIES: MBL fold metallo-hydrolase [Peptoniphilaceae]